MLPLLFLFRFVLAGDGPDAGRGDIHRRFHDGGADLDGGCRHRHGRIGDGNYRTTGATKQAQELKTVFFGHG